MSTVSILREVRQERARQDAKWGPIQTIPDFSPGIETMRLFYAGDLETAREVNEGPKASFESVLLEEVFEAMMEDDPVALRAELLQVAAVAVKWVEHIDRREGV